MFLLSYSIHFPIPHSHFPHKKGSLYVSLAAASMEEEDREILDRTRDPAFAPLVLTSENGDDDNEDKEGCAPLTVLAPATICMGDRLDIKVPTTKRRAHSVVTPTSTRKKRSRIAQSSTYQLTFNHTWHHDKYENEWITFAYTLTEVDKSPGLPATMCICPLGSCQLKEDKKQFSFQDWLEHLYDHAYEKKSWSAIQEPLQYLLLPSVPFATAQVQCSLCKMQLCPATDLERFFAHVDPAVLGSCGSQYRTTCSSCHEVIRPTWDTFFSIHNQLQGQSRLCTSPVIHGLRRKGLNDDQDQEEKKEKKENDEKDPQEAKLLPLEFKLLRQYSGIRCDRQDADEYDEKNARCARYAARHMPLSYWGLVGLLLMGPEGVLLLLDQSLQEEDGPTEKEKEHLLTDAKRSQLIITQPSQTMLSEIMRSVVFMESRVLGWPPWVQDLVRAAHRFRYVPLTMSPVLHSSS